MTHASRTPPAGGQVPASGRDPRARRVRVVGAVACWLVVWQVAAATVGQPILLVGPWEVAQRLVELVPTSVFWATVARTLVNVVAGFTLAALAGVLLAAAAAASRWVEALLAPLIATIRATPVVAFIILVLLWTESSRLAAVVSFLMALPVMYANVLEGVRRRDTRLLEMTRVFAVPWPRRLTSVDVPGVLPFFVAGCRSAVGLAWKSGIAAEVIGLPQGTIGEQMYQAKLFLATADLFAWTVVVVVLAALTERLVLALLDRACRRLTDGRSARATSGAPDGAR